MTCKILFSIVAINTNTALFINLCNIDEVCKLEAWQIMEVGKSMDCLDALLCSIDKYQYLLSLDVSFLKVMFKSLFLLASMESFGAINIKCSFKRVCFGKTKLAKRTHEHAILSNN